MGRIIPQESATVSGLGSFDFQGHDAAVYADDQGHWVFLNQLCGYMGIDANNQRKRLIRNRWSKGWTAILAVQVPGDVQCHGQSLPRGQRLPRTVKTGASLLSCGRSAPGVGPTFRAPPSQP